MIRVRALHRVVGWAVGCARAGTAAAKALALDEELPLADGLELTEALLLGGGLADELGVWLPSGAPPQWGLPVWTPLSHRPFAGALAAREPEALGLPGQFFALFELQPVG